MASIVPLPLLRVPMSVPVRLKALAEKWRGARAAERANFQSYLIELAAAIEVPAPQPAGTGYEFELPISMTGPDGKATTRFPDLVKAGHFLMEAKDEESGRSTDLLLRKAFGQASNYAGHLPGERPPYLIVLDVGATLLVWNRWDGDYGGFQAGHRIDLTTLHERPDDWQLLQDIWLNPARRDPRAQANRVTKEIAEKLAKLAARLEAQGHSNEEVAKFLIRCVFTAFAEDVGLLPDSIFTRATKLGLEDPAEFESALSDLWVAMDEGSRFGIKKLLRFNGHFFKERTFLAMDRQAVAVLHEAALADWTDVEPTIFGTLLTRALDPKERHRLGAEFTPREYVQRLVKPTIADPVRARWHLVEAEVLQLKEKARPIDRKRALKRLREFHAYLRGLKVLDPACGSGNFLYVALITLKEIELEVLREIEELTGSSELAVEEVDPSQFYGLEVKPWARELAELTLWVGYYQWWRQTHGHAMPPEPVLKDTGTIECRDAVLAWDKIVHVPENDRPDPTPCIEDLVTGKLVPDPEAKLEYLEHQGPRQAEWPEVDFIVGNPPYIGQGRMRDAFGDGYVEALRAAYSGEVPDSADFVMYWWHRAAQAVAGGGTVRAGLITTNSITQSQNRKLVQQASEAGAVVCWAAPDHPWVDESDGADVRVAMTVTARNVAGATRIEVDKNARIVNESNVQRLNADLTAHADVAEASANPLLANEGLSTPGFKLHGAGFVLSAEEAESLKSDPRSAEVVRAYRNGRDLASRPRSVSVIDFGLMTEDEARAYPVPFDIVRTRVKPHRDSNKREVRRKFWWRFGEPNPGLRRALKDLPRYIVTGETSKHRFFQFLDTTVAPDNMLVCIASADAFHLGVLSSSAHIPWSLAAGSRLGIGNDPRYNKSKCFDPFPFPDATEASRIKISDIAERLDRHRKDALERDEKVTMTGMYNVIEKLRGGEKLTPKDREVHILAACGVLKDLHDQLDAAVTEAYGWPSMLTTDEILDRLVKLHEERVAEEELGHVRWLRPAYQIPRFGADLPQALGVLHSTRQEDTGEAEAPTPWPESVPSQLAAIRDLVQGGPRTFAEIISAFDGGKRKEIRVHLEALLVLGLIREDDGVYHVPVQSAA